MLCCYYKKLELAELILQFVPEISIFEASALGKLDIVKKALDQNPQLINSFSEDGFTPLSISSYFGNEDITHLLLLNGADPNIPSNNN
jgi:ankyrin repeat protein